MKLITWDQYFKNITNLVATKSKCQRRMVGAIIVKNKRILSTGFNGLPPNFRDCDQGMKCGHSGQRKSGTGLHVLPCIHAEMNAILQCAKFGVSCNDAEIWLTNFPCNDCLKAIINAGIKRIHYMNEYKLDEAGEKTRIFLLVNSGIEVRKV